MEIFLKTVAAVNDETRVKLLGFIQKHGEMCVCELQQSFGMIQSRLSRHLKILKDGGFLRARREGKWTYFSIRSPLDEFRRAILEEIKTMPLDLPNPKKRCEL